MTDSSSPIDQEYQAFQSHTAFYVDQDARAIGLAGKDRLSFLHNFCTADIKALESGQSTEAFVLDPKGKTLYFIQVLATKDRLILVIPTTQLDALAAHLSKYVIVEDVTVEIAEDELVVYAGWSFPDSFTTHLFPDGFVGLLPEANDVTEGWEAADKICCSKETFETIRVENRFPQSGQDVTDDCLAQEFERNETAISFNKGCYLGQETVARLDALGHTNRSFQVAKCAPDDSPILESELRVAGKVCGKVTSSAWSPKHQCHLILAMIKKPHHQAGTELQLGESTVTVISG